MLQDLSVQYVKGVVTFAAAVAATALAAQGLTGAAAASRYAGATASGAPASGTFAVGDFVIDQTGKVWICVTAGSPGTWANAGSSSGVSSVTAGDTSIVIGGTGSAPTIATGPLDVIAADHPPAADWSNNSHKITSLANGSASSDAAAFGQILPLTGGVATGQITVTPATLTDAASIVVNAALSNTFKVTLGGNRTLASPSSPADGQSIVVEVIQDATGSRTLAYGAAYFFPASIGTPMLSTAPGSRDFLAFQYNADDTTWFCVGFVPAAAPAVPLTVAQGGTGLASLTAYGVLAGGTTSTGPVQPVAPGSSGQVLTSNGASALPTFQPASSGFSNPMTTLGDLIFENATPVPARLAGDTSNTRKFLRTQASAGVAQAPAWDTLLAADLPGASTSTQGAVILDGTAADIVTVGTANAAGAVGKAADAGHTHAAPLPVPADFGFQAWTIDPATANASDLMVSGTVYLMAFYLRTIATIGHLAIQVITAGSTLTAGDSLAGVYNSAGTLLGQTADQSGVWNATGAFNMALTSAITNAPVGKYYAALLSVGTTPPTVKAGATNAVLANAGLSGAGLRFAINGTGQTSLPGTVTPSSNVLSGAFPYAVVAS